MQNVKLSGEFQYKGNENDKSVFKDTSIAGNVDFSVKYGDLAFESVNVGGQMIVDQSYGELQILNMDVSGSSIEITKKYDPFNAENFNAPNALIKLHHQYSDTSFTTYKFQDIDFTEMNYGKLHLENGNVAGSLQIDMKYTDLTLKALTSNWGDIKVTTKYGDIDISNLVNMGVDVTTKYGDTDINLEDQYYGLQKVYFDLDSDQGDAKLYDAYGHTTLSEDKNDRKKGYINPSGVDNGKQIKVVSKYGDIKMHFHS